MTWAVWEVINKGLNSKYRSWIDSDMEECSKTENDRRVAEGPRHVHETVTRNICSCGGVTDKIRWMGFRL